MKLKSLYFGAAILGVTAMMSATPALADWHDHDGGGWGGGWHDHDGGGWRDHGGGWGDGWRFGFYAPPPPVYYAPPPPVYYAPPPPAYYGPPSVSLNFGY